MKQLLFICLAFFVNGAMAQTSNLTITIPNLKSTKGNIHVSVYNNKKTFPNPDGQYRKNVFKADKMPGTFVIKDLPKGDYSVAILHDENSDNKCNTNMLGIPKEGYGFSRNFKPKLAAPVFDDCRISINTNTAIEIKFIY